MSWEKKFVIPPGGRAVSTWCYEWRRCVEERVACTIWYVRDQGVEEECPGHRVEQRFLELVPLEVFVAYSLLIDADALQSQDAIFLLQPASVKLVVRNREEEDNSNSSSHQAGRQEQYLPPR